MHVLIIYRQYMFKKNNNITEWLAGTAVLDCNLARSDL